MVLRRKGLIALLRWVLPATMLILVVSAEAPAQPDYRALVDQYCTTCHNEKAQTGGLALDVADLSNPGELADIWEKVSRKL
jgi:hypothetical protein